jgi:transcriptional regulator with XRE-family HTH domain
MATGDGIGKRIQLAREARGISKSHLARAVGVTPMAVVNWENKEITPRSLTLSRVAFTLGVSEDWLRTGERDQGRPDNGTEHPGKNPPLPGSPSVRSVATVLEEAKTTIAAMTGFDPARVKIHLEFPPD